MTAPEPLVMEALQGFTDNADKWPGPRIVKIFISSVFSDFREDRKQMLEVVGPELQSTYDDRNIEVEFVDMQYGCDGGDENNPRLLRCHLEEIRSTYRTSRAGYFLCILGGDASNYKPVLPFQVRVEHFEELLRQCDKLQLQSSILKECYRLEGETHQVYELVDDDQWYDDLSNRSKQRQALSEVEEVFTRCALAAAESCEGGGGGGGGDKVESYSTLLRSAMEIQCALALELLKGGIHPHGVIALTKKVTIDEKEGKNKKLLDLAKKRLDALKSELEAALPKDNIICLEDDQTELVRDGVMSAVDALIDASLSSEPDHGKGRKKTVQEVFQEHITHLRTCIEHNTKSKITSKQLQAVSDSVIDHMKENYKAQTKHTPCLIHGPDASGKTTLLTHLYDASASIFPKPVFRIIRFSAATPRSAYNLELLRVLCQQISIVLKIPEGYLPKDASFDPLYINNWFQNLLKRCEELDNEVLMIFIDNVHRVNPLECDIVNGLSWLPMILPKNVYFICTTAIPLEQLQLTTAQKEKFRSTNCYHLLEAIEETEENKSRGTYIEGQFDKLEKVFGVKAFSKLASYMTCSEFGLTETELLELLMPTSNSDAVIQLRDGNFTFSTLCVAKTLMAPLLVEKCVSGRAVSAWRAAGAGARARRRYVRAQGTLRDAHSDLASLYFAHFCTDDDDDEETKPDEEVASVEPEDDDALLGSTPFHSASRTAAAFTQRHVEESWLHLLLAGDFVKLKDLTVCNFDFLLAAVQTVTISYLRCVLEHVRCYILDRDVELVYGAVKKASDILTRDPMQLGSQIIAWLRPAVSRRGVLATLVTAAMAWCDGYDKPLLVPLNGWLHPPIASTVRVVSVGGGGARLLQLAPSSQHLVLAPAQGDPQLWHLMSNSRVHTFKGHSGRVLCMAVTRESQFLLTGSEDTTVIVWDLHTLAVKLKIAEHIAPVLCVAAAVSRSLVISGGEDSAIIVTSLHDGSLVTKLDHHRGPVTGIKIVQDGDILVSCSQDGTVCSWSTDSFSLLNSIATDKHAPVHMMELSEDSVFLLTLEDDNELHLRTLITGTQIHTLKRHKAKVTCFCIAGDSARAAVGCADQRVLVYSLHSAALLRALPAAHDLTALAVTHHDHFLLAAGGNRVTVYSFHTEDTITNFRPTKQKRLRQTKSTTTLSLLQAEQSELIPISCLDVSRDGQLGASGCAQGVVRVWQLSTHRLAAALRAHSGHVTCVAFSPNNLLVLSGSEDRSVVVWQLADHLPIRTYRGHTASIQSVSVMGDGRRAVSGDRARKVHVWLLDSGIVLHTAADTPTAHLAVTNNMKFAVCTDFDNTVRIWSLSKCEEDRRTVSHAERVTCLVLTVDGTNLVTGSEDMSLKVWQVDGGKLSQVLVGHTGAVSCAAVSVSCRAQVVSGSCDGHLIVWDINTGADLHLLSGHLAKVICVKLTGDGTIAVSGSEDKTLIIWETKRGLALTSLALHVPLVGFEITNDCSRLVVHLQDRGCLPIICLHNTPAVYVKIPTYAAPAKDIDELRPLAPKRPMRRLLKKEVSLDTYTWQKKYGHLTSAAMMAQVDERLKRRFSVSASMEEISKIQQEKNKDLGSQASLGPEQAALAQSQHFDQLEALWNKVSPPRRRSNKSFTKQSSLIESRFDSSDEEHTPVDEQEHMLE